MPSVVLPGGRTVEVPTAGRRSVRAGEIYTSIPTGYSLVRRQPDGSLRQVQPQEEVKADEEVYGQPRNTAGN